MNKWISIEDRLPKGEWVDVLVYPVLEGEVRGDAYWQDGYGFGLHEGCQPLDEVTHWMPFPDKPTN